MPSPRLERSTHARAAVSETVMVKRAGIGTPACVIHRRRVGVSPDASAREVMDLLRTVQIKLAMGAPVASLVNVVTGEELTFLAYAEAKERAFPAGSSYLALTAAEMHARCANPARVPKFPKVPKVEATADAAARPVSARPLSARAEARSRPLALPSPRRMTPRAIAAAAEALEERPPKSPLAERRVGEVEAGSNVSHQKPASPAVAAKALLGESPPGESKPMKDLDANAVSVTVPAPVPALPEKESDASSIPAPGTTETPPAPEPEDGETIETEKDLRDVINHSRSKKKNKKKK